MALPRAASNRDTDAVSGGGRRGRAALSGAQSGGRDFGVAGWRKGRTKMTIAVDAGSGAGRQRRDKVASGQSFLSRSVR